MRLTASEMRSALADMEDALARALELVMIDEESFTKINAWLTEVELYNVHTIFRPDMIEQINLRIVNDESVRNFLFDIQFRFYAAAGTGENFLEKLCKNLEDGLVVDGPTEDFNVLKRSLADSMPLAFFKGSVRPSNWFVRQWRRIPWVSKVTLHEFLLSNPLLVTILLLYLVHRNSKPTESKQTP